MRTKSRSLFENINWKFSVRQTCMDPSLLSSDHDKLVKIAPFFYSTKV